MTVKTIKYIFVSFLATTSLSTSCTIKNSENEHSNKQKSLKIEEEHKQLPPPKMEKDGGIQLEYSNTINNYKVYVNWYPHNDAREGAVKGKGIIHFYHTSEVYFSIEHNNFYLSNEVPIKFENNSLILPEEKNISLDYIPYPENELFIKTKLPFVFYDTNFDGDKEIVLIHPKNSKQTEDSLSVFATNYYSKDTSPSDQITYNKPYCNMNSNTEFNHQEKTVTLHSSKNGITETRIYKHNIENNELQFEIVEGKYKELSYVFDNSWDEEIADTYLNKFHEEINNGVDLYSTDLMRRILDN